MLLKVVGGERRLLLGAAEGAAGGLEVGMGWLWGGSRYSITEIWLMGFDFGAGKRMARRLDEQPHSRAAH